MGRNIREAFADDSVDKQLKITYSGGVTVGNPDLQTESLTLEEKLCDTESLTFGSCNASCLEITVLNNIVPLKGKELTLAFDVEGVEEPFTLGTYKVDSDKPTADRRYRDIVAYDAMYDIINADVAEWYNKLLPSADSKVTLREFRNSFFEHFGIEQEETDLVNDKMTVGKTIEPSELSGKTVIEAVCEINGCFGHIARDGRFRFVQLKELVEGVYPRDTLYPRDDLYPAEPQNSEKISRSQYISCQYEDYVCQRIDSLQIRQEENDIGAVSGTGKNRYVVEDNFLVYGKTAADLQTIADNLYSVISIVRYRPASVEARGNPCLEVGDGIRLNTDREIIYTYILRRTLKGIQALKDSYGAEGVETYGGELNSVSKSIIQLKGKTNLLTRTVEETRLEMSDIEQNLSTRISVTASGLDAEITRASSAEGSLSNRISVTASGLDAEITRASSAEGSLSNRISVTASGLDAEITRASSAEGSLSNRINVTASGLDAEITRASSAEGDLSNRISVTASGLEAEITRASTAEGNLSARISANAEQISLKVSRGNIVSEINQTAESIKISASRIDLDGIVNADKMVAKYMEVENWVSGGYIKAGKIDAGRITAGTLSVNRLDVDGLMSSLASRSIQCINMTAQTIKGSSYLYYDGSTGTYKTLSTKRVTVNGTTYNLMGY